MPSDDRVQRALESVSTQIAAYQAVVTMARERVRALLAQGGGAERAALELGQFGALRLDLDRFASLGDGVAIDAAGRSRLRRIGGVLDDLASQDATAFVVDVLPGGRLRYFVANALASLGRVFGALAAIELIRSGRYDPVSHDGMLEAYAFDRWTKADRAACPPVIVTLAGSDLRANLLAEFLDGNMKIVLLADGRTTPAPLVRLVTPGTLVLQTSTGDGLDRFTRHHGPSVAALVPPSAATFIHDPAAGRHLWQRMKVWSVPDRPPRGRVDTWSAAQQIDELRQLEGISEQPTLSGTPVDELGAGPGDAVDRLTSWLLAESGVA